LRDLQQLRMQQRQPTGGWGGAHSHKHKCTCTLVYDAEEKKQKFGDAL
jgi:hypothetical protein